MSTLNKIISIVTARSGSKSVVGKNIRHLGGIPLLAYPIIAAKKSKLIDNVYVSTDSEKYAEIARSYGALVPHLRPPHLAEDVPSEDVLTWEVAQIEKELGYKLKIIVLHQCTTPLITTEDIDQCILKLHGNWAESVITVCRMNIHPFWWYTMDDNGKLTKFMRGKIQGEKGVRQLLPPCYRITGQIYALKRGFLMNQHRILGDRMYGVETPAWRSHDIDEEDDFPIIETFVPRYREKNG